MAQPPASTKTTDQTAQPKSYTTLAVMLIVLNLLLVIIGVPLMMGPLRHLVGDFLDLNHTQTVGAPAAVGAEPLGADLFKPPAFVNLEAFTVNLQEEDGRRYLQAILALRVADQKTADALVAFTPEIRHRINLLLSGKAPSEVATPEAREALAGEIASAVNETLGFPSSVGAQGQIISRGPVRAVLFNSLLVQ